MANRTVKDAHTIKGTNPQYLIEKIIRTRIYDCKYWKEECFALSADLIAEQGMELRFIGGTFGGNIQPTPFICLILKMLQIQPDKDIIVEFIRQEDFKYVRAMGALYMRLTGTSVEIYKYLEPLYNDYRKLRCMNRNGEFEIMHMDEYIDSLLHEERSFDIQLPRLQSRDVLEENNQLEPRVSALDEDLDSAESSDDEANLRQPTAPVSKEKKSPERKRSRSPKRSRDHDRDRGSTSRRSRDRSPERRRKSPVRKQERDKGSNKDKSGGSRKPADDKNKKRHREDSYEREIREANELRAKLGLKPLEQ